jgi:hypothetical protein
MKKIFLPLVTLLILAHVPNPVCAQTNSTSVEYLDEITATLSELNNETWQYLKAITRGRGERKIDHKRRNLIEEIQNIKSEINNKGSFESDESLKNAALTYLDISYIVLKEDYDKIMDMEEIAEQSYDMMEAYILAQEKAGETLNNAWKELVRVHEEFAFRHNITIVPGELDKMSQRIVKASESLHYYNEIYLIFFKAYKQEAYVLEALDRSDINALEQNISALKTFAAEGLEKLKETESYYGDPNLKVTARKLLTFFMEESEKEFPVLIDFFIIKDNLEKVQKMVELKSEKKRTQQDIDQFNKAVNEYNDAVKSFNQVLERTNNRRNKYLEQWNDQVNAFFNKHSE